MKIITEKNGPVTTIIINRPEVRNALDKEATVLLAQAFRDFEQDESARVAVLCGAEGAFCAGADLKELATGEQYEAWAGADGPLARPAAKPVIAAVSGHACAGGLGVALWCDIRIAEQSASFAVLSRRWGVPMSDGTTVRLSRIIGRGRALHMLLAARPVNADEALAYGLVTQIVPDGRARAEAEALANTIAGFPPIAMQSDRQSAYEQEDMPMAAALIREAALAQDAKAREAQAGAQRFAQGAGRHGSIR
ncbi:crotonase/enoyl-CoA hydratase family protein [Pusillimonas sp. TS35]|nr:crotonase/enoyl-CoA hydratase family protein [Pusillimonas sp. TS35]